MTELFCVWAFVQYVLGKIICVAASLNYYYRVAASVWGVSYLRLLRAFSVAKYYFLLKKKPKSKSVSLTISFLQQRSPFVVQPHPKKNVIHLSLFLQLSPSDESSKGPVEKARFRLGLKAGKF